MKQKIMPIANLIFLFLFLISYTRADLPVHCLVSDTAGEWVIRINKERFDAHSVDYATTCDHGLPNIIDIDGNKKLSWPDYFDLEITLSDNYKIYQNEQLVGHWTPVYDQSFVIYYKNSVLTAPYRYFKNGSNEYKSDCKKTLAGWYTPDYDTPTKNWSCFFAFKKGSNLRSFLQIEEKGTSNNLGMSFAEVEQSHNLHNNLKYENLNNMVEEINNANLSWKADVHEEFRGMSLLQLRSHLGLRKGQVDKLSLEKQEVSDSSSSMIQVNKLEKMDTDLKEFLDKLNAEEQKIEKIGTAIEEEAVNESNKKGRFQSTTNSQISSESETNSQAEGNKILPINEEAATTKNTLKDSKHNSFSGANRDKDSRDVKDFSEVSKYLNTPLDAIDEETLPKNWDWRNVGGINYVPRVKRQGHCGSCYVFSTVTCLESRLRIRTNNQDQTEFSKQFPLSCNFYSEGCNGGYPFLVGKFFHEFEILPETCFPYTQTNDSCSNVCDYKKLPKKYKVSKYGYLGGYYGATNEILMMKELRSRGPIPGNIRVPFSFNYYKSGIFSESELTKNSNRLSKTTLVDRHLSWEKVEHSITLIGYGEENGVKYWIGMNTWGTNWGDNGFFKILRGENECAVESMGDFIDIEILNRNQQ
jgi:C1A family cysteine protease